MAKVVKPVPTIDVLRRAREIITDPERWCRHSYAVTADDVATRSDSDSAAKFCAFGAISRACMEHGLYEKGVKLTSEELFRNSLALNASLDRLAACMFPRYPRLQWVNDSVGREAAIEVLDAAIAELSR